MYNLCVYNGCQSVDISLARLILRIYHQYLKPFSRNSKSKH